MIDFLWSNLVIGQAAGTAVPSFTSELLRSKDTDTDPQTEFNIKWSAASMYSGALCLRFYDQLLMTLVLQEARIRLVLSEVVLLPRY
jgi:hypothetical protein